MYIGSDEKYLVALVAQGDEGAFRQIFDLYRDKLYAYSLKFTKSKVSAEEIVQEVFIKIWENKARLNPELSFRAYLYKITQNQVFDYLKKAANDITFRKAMIRWVDSYADRVEDGVIMAEYEEVVRQAVEQLPPQRKLIFQLSRDHYMSHEEIATQLGISKNTVKVQIVKAGKFIKEYFYHRTDVMLSLFLLFLFF